VCQHLLLIVLPSDNQLARAKEPVPKFQTSLRDGSQRDRRHRESYLERKRPYDLDARKMCSATSTNECQTLSARFDARNSTANDHEALLQINPLRRIGRIVRILTITPVFPRGIGVAEPKVVPSTVNLVRSSQVLGTSGRSKKRSSAKFAASLLMDTGLLLGEFFAQSAFSN
jgi:hypothetical protein